MTTLKLEIDITGYNEGSLIDQIASQAAESIRMRCESDMRKMVKAAVEKNIEHKAEEMVASWLSLPLRLTNQYGEEKGAPVPLSEYVISKFKDHMEQAVKPDGRLPDHYDKNTSKRLDWIVAKIVTDKLEEAVKAAVSEARKKGEDAMRAAVADLMTKHLPKPA